MGVLMPQETTAMISLPLPAALERLLRVFGAVNSVYGWLLRNRIQVTPVRDYGLGLFLKIKLT